MLFHLVELGHQEKRFPRRMAPGAAGSQKQQPVWHRALVARQAQRNVHLVGGDSQTNAKVVLWIEPPGR
jgi:hypothetical protein